MNIEYYLDLLEDGVDDDLVIRIIAKDYKIKIVKDKQQGGSVKDVIDKVIYGKKDYSPKMKAMLQKHGGDRIKLIQIWRTPVQSVFVKALSLLSFGEFQNKMDELGFDKLFHLAMVVKTEKGINILIEKNEVINTDYKPKKKDNTEVKMISNIPANTTINMLLENANNVMGDKRFFKYNAKTSNCQDFNLALLKGINLNTPQNTEFIKQDTKQLFEGLNFMRKVANSTTDVGATAQVIMQGGKLKKRK